MTEKDELQYGVEYPSGSGQMHYAFELRLPTVSDNIDAIETSGGGSNLRLNTMMLAASLVKLGSIPREAITFELLSTMVDDDYDVMTEARDRLKKKRMRPKSNSADSDSPSSSSAGTASPSPGSGS
ncbi:hypothetical protein [Chromobacterium haemolyticum]|uniref:hypothetical protein n=1 Tax=Chromobacterium haemolyticum TaxID=394935 RepID=UPI0017471C07|nr:hypothetical protein [Chromobacterium haemolyticum]QOD81432.1 hypothetical protein IEZ30_16095 [Chromobacterium haemolyticum]